MTPAKNVAPIGLRMSKRAVLLVNLGSPDSTSVPDVRRYLREFLGDERVLDLPAPFRWLLLEGIILRTRPKKSAHAYEEIWTKDGSPLVLTSKRVAAKLAEHDVKTRDDLAELAVDELTEMTGIDDERAKEIILKARAHWFE